MKKYVYLTALLIVALVGWVWGQATSTTTEYRGTLVASNSVATNRITQTGQTNQVNGQTVYSQDYQGNVTGTAFFEPSATINTLAWWNGTPQLASFPTGLGAMTNDGGGHIGWNQELGKNASFLNTGTVALDLFPANYGTAGSNFSLTIGLNSTNLTEQVGAACTNLVNLVGAACTNGYTALSTIVSNGIVAWANATFAASGSGVTSFGGDTGAITLLSTQLAMSGQQLNANGLGAASTNLANAIGLASTNLANAIGLASTNWANLIGTTISNLVYVNAPTNSLWGNLSASVGNAGWVGAYDTNIFYTAISNNFANLASGAATNWNLNPVTNHWYDVTMNTNICFTNLQGLQPGLAWQVSIRLRNTNAAVNYNITFADGPGAIASGGAPICAGALTNGYVISNSVGYYVLTGMGYGTNYMTNASWAVVNPSL